MNSSRPYYRGLTLAEAIVSIFVLLTGIIVTVRLFHTGLRYQTLVNNRITASMLAEREMERVRGWSRKQFTSPGATADFNNFLNENYPGKTAYQDPNFPEFQIEALATASEIYSPCSLFEKLQPVSNRRLITAALRKITVTVSWGWDPTNSKMLSHQLTSLVGWPTPANHPPEPALINPVMPGSPNISKDDTRKVTSLATDRDGHVLGDLFYNYIIQPGVSGSGGGFGVVEKVRDGRSATIRNSIYDAFDQPIPSAYGLGTFNLIVMARYRGNPIQGVKNNLDMVP